MRYQGPDNIAEDGTVRAIALTVLRNTHGDFSNGGATGSSDTIYMACENGPSRLDPDSPLLFRLETSSFPGAKAVHLVPYSAKLGRDGGAGPMFGGSFAFASDARFRAELGAVLASDADAWLVGAVPVHDRFETWEQYRASSM